MTLLWNDFITEKPESVETAVIRYNTKITIFESKKKHYASKSDTPEQSWRLTWGVVNEDTINSIYHFYTTHKGAGIAFYWDHPYENTTLDVNEVGQTVLNVAQTTRVLAGDTIRIADTTNYTVGSVQNAAKTITITGAAGAEAIAGAAIQVRYTVRFASELNYDTIKAWLYKVGLLFERDLG